MANKIISPLKKSEAPLVLNRSNFLVKKLTGLINRLKARHQKHYRDSNFHLWADLLLAGVLVSLVIIVWRLIFWQPQADFSLSGQFVNGRILSGQAEEIIITYQNEETDVIKNVSLELAVPDDFMIESATPPEIFNAETKTFNLGELAKNDRGELRLRGIPRAAVGEKQSLGLNLTYQLGQIRKNLLGSVTYLIDGSVMELELDVPAEVYEAVAFNGSVIVKNSGEVKLENMALAFPSLDWELTFDEAVLENGRLALSTLAPGETTKLTFTATNKQTVATSSFMAQGLFLVGDKTLKQVEISKTISIAEPSLALTANFVEPALTSNTVNANLSFKNNGQAEINNLSLVFENKRSTFGVSSVLLVAKDFTATNNAVAYNKNLLPGEKKDFTLVIKLEQRGTDLNDWLSLSTLISYTMDGQEFKYTLPLPRLKINSNLTVDSAAYYYGPQGDQLGIGPLPPKVDIPTTYWVIWEANNLGNDIADFEVSADLPSNAVWLDQKSVVTGDVTYSPIGRRILWQVDELSKTGANYRVSFAISLVPREQDLGTEPILLSNLKFRGLDLYTNNIILKNLANITTNLPKDRKSTGKSVVESFE